MNGFLESTDLMFEEYFIKISMIRSLINMEDD